MESQISNRLQQVEGAKEMNSIGKINMIFDHYATSLTIFFLF